MAELILEANGLKKSFGKKEVLNGVSFSIPEGACMGLLGESGCGKSTTASVITGMLRPDGGTVKLLGAEAVSLKKIDRRIISGTVQMVFQNPGGALDPRRRLYDSIIEPLLITKKTREEKRYLAEHVLEHVGLPAAFLEKYPWEISGGECQRVTLARAIIRKPKLLICDEATSALDVSVQAQIVQLISSLQKELAMSVLFISHDVALAAGLCDRIAVMQDGRIIENRLTEEILSDPKENYTRLLLGFYGSGPAVSANQER